MDKLAYSPLKDYFSADLNAYSLTDPECSKNQHGGGIYYEKLVVTQ
jgi:hypothetical protein